MFVGETYFTGVPGHPLTPPSPFWGRGTLGGGPRATASACSPLPAPTPRRARWRLSILDEPHGWCMHAAVWRVCGIQYPSRDSCSGSGVIWSAVIPAKAGIHAATMALPLCTSPSGLELLGSNESNLPLDSRFRGNDCLHRPARKINFPQMTPVPRLAGWCRPVRFEVCDVPVGARSTQALP